MHCSGLILSPKMASGFKFTIMDVSHTEGDRVIELNAPEELYDIAALLRDPERFVVESIHSREDGGVEVQFNVMGREDLLAAQTNPDPELLVRVSGYTAYFKDLNQDMQQEIISRTEYNLPGGRIIPLPNPAQGGGGQDE